MTGDDPPSLDLSGQAAYRSKFTRSASRSSGATLVEVR